MKLTGLLTTAFVLGLAGMASAGCMDMTTATKDMTPLPTADAGKATATPSILLPQDGAKTEEG
ncbi:hypothetical protein HMH01_14295 [Halovulum dunhuangense]|uniref:Uncharacterized protein n=1 Tax=Halovulum dunhuangense TaxID=1505036 RepID=A0A849L684_9RHOB|nr:hypothetical protein [Halovulum dunhuangense]NNU81607.1 hypothetical protein [Halovulum dunhuangense]